MTEYLLAKRSPGRPAAAPPTLSRPIGNAAWLEAWFSAGIRAVRSALIACAFVAWSHGVALAQGNLTNGGNHGGTIAIAGQLDVWTFAANKGDTILLSIGEVMTSQIDPGFAPWIRLFDPNTTQLGSSTGPLAGQITVTAPLTGTYTVRVADSSINRPGTALGSYSLRLVQVPGNITVPPGDQGGPMTNGANHSGVIDVGDLDPWTFQAAKGESINLSIGEVILTETDPGFAPFIQLYGPDGVLLGFGSGPLAAQIEVTAPLTGLYTVVVSDSSINRPGSATGSYSLTLVKAPGTFHVSDGDEGGSMVNGGNYSGLIRVGDLDPWTFEVSKGDAINLSIGEVLTSETDPGFAPWIRLYGPTGALLGFGTGNWAGQISVTAPLSGTYTVVVADSSINRPGSATGNYVLTLAKAPGAFIVPPGDDGGPISNQTVYSGAIYRGDLDPWSFVAAKDAAITVRISEVIEGEVDPGFAPWIRLFGPDGTLLGSSSGALTGQINLTTPLSGVYTVVVADSSINRPGDAAGKYQLSAVGIPSQSVAPAITLNPQPQTVKPGQMVQFLAAANGSPTPSVQWQVSADNATTWVNISGATNASYTLLTGRLDSQKRFRAQFTNTAGTVFTAGATLTVLGPNPSDIDGDNKADLTVWRGDGGIFYWLNSSTNNTNYGQKQWGDKSAGDVPLVGDIDGDGKKDLIVWRASTGTWYWVTSSSGFDNSAYGFKDWGVAGLGDVPLLADIDGDGKSDLIVWRASTGTWYWVTSSTGYSNAAYGSKVWGNASLGDRPLVGDVDGDGSTDLIVWRASTGEWLWVNSSNGYANAASGSKVWGISSLGDVPLIADIDGDGRTDFIVWRASSGTFYWLTSSSGYDDAAYGARAWGLARLGDTPLVGDLDGDNKADLAVWRGSEGGWYWLTSMSGYDYSSYGARQWGSQAAGDAPLLR